MMNDDYGQQECVEEEVEVAMEVAEDVACEEEF